MSRKYMGDAARQAANLRNSGDEHGNLLKWSGRGDEVVQEPLIVEVETGVEALTEAPAIPQEVTVKTNPPKETPLPEFRRGVAVYLKDLEGRLTEHNNRYHPRQYALIYWSIFGAMVKAGQADPGTKEWQMRIKGVREAADQCLWVLEHMKRDLKGKADRPSWAERRRAVDNLLAYIHAAGKIVP